MAAMDFKINDSVVGKCLDYRYRPEAKKIISRANDGTAYAQSVGLPTRKYIVDVYCASGLARTMVDLASTSCAAVTFVDRKGSEHTGFIEDDTIEWKEWKDGHGVGQFTIIQE